ncbi:unnamed protein product, partial [Brenthis ino]
MEKGGGSRLLQMQARFQQKQLQERELKIASLYEAQQARALDRVRHSPSNGMASTPTPTVTHQPGKVRQMFEERRTKAGIDKSYPLQPIQNTDRMPSKKTLPNGYSKVSTNRTLEKKSSTVKTHTSISSHTMKKQSVIQNHKMDNLVNGSGDLNHNHEEDLNVKRVSNGDVEPSDETDHVNGTNGRENDNYLLENETFPEALAPAATPRSPEPIVEAKKTIRRSPATRPKSPVTRPKSPAKRPKSPVKSKSLQSSTTPRRTVSENKVSDREDNKPKAVMQRGTHSVLRKTSMVSPQANSTSKVKPAPAAAGEGGCPTCGRRFAPDRLLKHQEICRKTHAKKRKPYDVLKHRLAGTEAESFITKIRKSTTTPSSTKTQKPTNSSWRQKHEEFIRAIRAAKQVQAHLNAGGKLSDLPPPPPSENPDYVQCPHCQRRFNQGAAERHIPKCANFQFNKPKPPPKRR